MGITTVQAWECDVCGYVWLKVKGRIPTHCPNRGCRSRKWNAKPKGPIQSQQVNWDAVYQKSKA